MRRCWIAAGFLLAMLASSSSRADDPKLSLAAALRPLTLAPGDAGVLTVTFDVPAGFHLWGLDPGPGPMALTMRLDPKDALELEGAWHGPEPVRAFDRGFNRELFRYDDRRVVLERVVRAPKNAKEGALAVGLVVRAQICTEEQCLNEVRTVPFQVAIAGKAATSPAAAPALAGVALTQRAAAAASQPAATATGNAGFDDKKNEGLLSFILLAFAFGLGALATPCVFPAIPLTVSFFSKYAEESFARGARLAAVYALTMVGAFTLAGVAISILFGVTGIQQFAAHPVFNLVLAGVLVFFSLNLLGLFEIRAPTFAMTAVNKLEHKFGRAPKADGVRRGGIGDYVVVGVAALTATTVFFTCTVAFVGLVLVAAAKGEWVWPTIGMLSFSSAFALPFFLLAMFPQAARRLRGKAGSWLGATRVTLGFLELAAAMKFFSNADLVWSLGWATREVILAIWIPLFMMCGLFLLGKLHIGEESPGREGRTSVFQMLAATGMFSLSLYLAVGLFAGRTFGGWIDGWLPPLTYPGRAPVVAGEQLDWIPKLEDARQRAKANGKLVFVNYTGYTCTNCRYMEGAVFTLPDISRLLSGMTLAELYTDGGTPEQDANRKDQIDRFGTAALPFYSVERPNGEVLATFPSSTNDPAEFKRFLEKALADAAKPSAKKKSLVLSARRLSDGGVEPAIAEGRWTLINFWATWCAPCREELQAFLAARGRDFEAHGGRFVAVAIEEDDTVSAADGFMKSLSVPSSSALRLPGTLDASLVDPAFEFDGAQLPYTVLVSPEGEVVWKHRERLDADRLRAVLVQYTGFASR